MKPCADLKTSLFAVLLLVITEAASGAITGVTVDQESPGTVVSVDSFTGTTSNFTISTPLSEPETDLLGLFSFVAHFTTDGVAGSLTITETITNSGSLPWEEWIEVAAGFYDLFPSTPENVTWGSTFASSRSGTFDLIELPEFSGFPEGTFSSTVFRFDTVLNPLESFTLTKTLQYADGGAPGGVQRLDVVNLPAAVPLPPALGMFLAAVAALSFVGIRRRHKIANESIH